MGIADDHCMYPDHVERLIVAMLRSGTAAAHSNTLIRFERRAEDGSTLTTGFNAAVFNGPTFANEEPVLVAISKRSISDREMQTRLWQRYPVGWVDHVTAEVRVRENDATPYPATILVNPDRSGGRN